MLEEVAGQPPSPEGEAERNSEMKRKPQTQIHFSGGRDLAEGGSRRSFSSLAARAAERRRQRLAAAPEEDAAGEPRGGDESLEEAARSEQEYLRGRLREQLGREPTEQEQDEWLRRHTEGY